MAVSVTAAASRFLLLYNSQVMIFNSPNAIEQKEELLFLFFSRVFSISVISDD